MSQVPNPAHLLLLPRGELRKDVQKRPVVRCSEEIERQRIVEPDLDILPTYSGPIRVRRNGVGTHLFVV